MADESKTPKADKRQPYETPQLRRYGSLTDIVQMKGVAGQTDPAPPMAPTKTTSAS